MHRIVYILAIPTFVVGWLYVVLTLAFGLSHIPHLAKPFIISAEWRPWVANLWRYSTTIGRGIVMHPTHPVAIWKHELVHVRQTEDLSAHALAAAIVLVSTGGNWIAGLVLWMTSPIYPMLLNLLMSGLRHGWEKSYRESEHERAAYAQSNPHDHHD